MKKSMILAVKGFFIGLANIIPGVSGGTMAISFGIYEELITIISNIFKDFKKNMKFLIPLVIGAGISIALLSNVITASLDTFKIATPLLFIGLIIGGFPTIYKKVNKKIVKPKNLIVFLITIIFMVVLYLGIKDIKNITFTNMTIIDYIILFIVGVIAAITMVVPGISGSFVLMLIGYYEPIVEVISELTKFNNIITNLLILIPFSIGALIGIVTVAKLIKHCLKHFEEQTYSAIVAFVISSIFIIVYPLLSTKCSLIELIVGLILMVIGSVITYEMERI